MKVQLVRLVNKDNQVPPVPLDLLVNVAIVDLVGLKVLLVLQV